MAKLGAQTKTAAAVGGSDWRLLSLAAIAYAALYGATTYFFQAVPPPLPASADPWLFAEGRVMQHLNVLVEEIGHRHVSSWGEEQAAQYIHQQLRQVADLVALTRPDLTAEVARESVSGGVTMHAFKFQLGNMYRNLTNLVLRLAPADPVAAAKKAVLVVSHYDSTIGTKGASDAASCVCIILELARTLAANPSLTLHSPVVFLLNGGEETLSQAANGFYSSSKFASQLGAFINLESTGPWGPDVLFQHTGDWTLEAYARSAPHPRGTTLAQDFFDLGLIPADTDFRMLSYRHYGGLPGIDIAFVFDGTAYHTLRDELARIRPGTLQDMGENVLAAVQEYSRVLASDPPTPTADTASGAVYFDLFGRVMVVYTHAQAKALHHAPLVLLLLMPLLSAGAGSSSGSSGAGASWLGMAGNALLALAAVLGAVLLPAGIGAARGILSGVPMVWYGRPAIANAIFVPAAVAGILLPYALLPARPLAAGSNSGSTGAAGQSLGFALLFAIISTQLTSIGMHSAFFYALWAGATALSTALLGAAPPAATGGSSSWGGAAALLALHLPPLAVALPSAVSFMSHIMEKVGMAGAAPGLLGLAIADVAVAAAGGAAIYLTLGTLTPHIAASLGPRRGRGLVAALLAASLATAGWASVQYRQPYSRDHPKRLLIQHIHQHAPDGTVEQSRISAVGVDSFPLEPLLPASFLQQPAEQFQINDWTAMYPINYLVDTGVAWQAPGPEPEQVAPSLRLVSRQAAAPLDTPAAVAGDAGAAAAAGAAAGGARQQQHKQQQAQELERLEFELDTSKPAWGVLNITGPVMRWSVGDEVAVSELEGGGVAHLVRFAGNVYTTQQRFWLDVPAGSHVSIQAFVKHVEESAAVAALVSKLPEWVSPMAVVTWQSSWHF